MGGCEWLWVLERGSDPVGRFSAPGSGCGMVDQPTPQLGRAGDLSGRPVDSLGLILINNSKKLINYNGIILKT